MPETPAADPAPAAASAPEANTASRPAAPEREVRILDIPAKRVRRPGDLVLMLASLLGIGVVLALSVYAYGTTTGVTEDVQSALAQTVRRILLVPVNVIEGLLILILPIVVIVERLIKRNLRTVLEAISASVVAFAVALGTIWLLDEFAQPELTRSLMRFRDGQWVVLINPAVAALAGLLTAIGSRARRRSVALSWNLLWGALALSAIMGDSPLVGSLIAVLIGRAAGLGMRYASGVLSERAHGADLVDGIRRAGIDPVAVIRIGDSTHSADLRPETASISSPVGYQSGSHHVAHEPFHEPPLWTEPRGLPLQPGHPEGFGAAAAASSLAHPALAITDVASILARIPESATVATEREGQNRVYAVLDSSGVRWDAVVLDGDRAVIGFLAGMWSTLRLRGLERRTAVSLRQAADHAALMYYAATAAGVNSPRLHGIAESAESVLLLGEHVDQARNLSDYPVAQVTDDVMANAWRQLLTAHAAGIAHRNLSAETVLLVGAGERKGEVWLNGWEQGEIASTALARRVDLAQLLTVFALRVGAARAIAVAAQVLSPAQLADIAPLLQPVAFPPQTRAEARANRAGMSQLRAQLVELIPTTSEMEPIKLTRFSARTVATLTIAVVAGWVLLTTLNFQQIAEVVADANPMWMLAAFVFGLLTYVGSAMGLVAFSPDKLGLWRTTLVQVAASVVTLVAPAGVGPAALNLRFMQRRGVQTPMALATVALLQVSQFVTTVLLLLAIALLTGSSGALEQLPSAAIVITVLAVAAVAGVLFAVPRLRKWILKKSLPTLRQVWPRLVWVVGQPGRLAMGIGGNLLMTIGYLAAFGAAVEAFGNSLPVTSLAIIYLTGTAVGSAIPTPGGIGTVELALSTGLRTAGIATAAAASTAVLFRVLTFWARVPLGWAALRYLQNRNLL